MEYQIEKIEELSGKEASIYSISLEDPENNKLEEFVLQNEGSFKSEIENILDRLYVIGNDTGVRDHFLKKNEGRPGDDIYALFDDPDRKLRLYCIKFGRGILVLGGGGPKPQHIRALQEDPQLKKENYFLRKVSEDLLTRIRNREIVIAEDGKSFDESSDLFFGDF